MTIALIAHDSKKELMVQFCTAYCRVLSQHRLVATGTTGKLIAAVELPTDETTADGATHLEVIRLLSGPLGGDQQIGAMIAEGKIDCLIFFCDNLITQGHQQDVGALSRLASLYNIAFATNRTTADMILTSPLWKDADYQPILPECINNYKNRKLQ